MSLLLLFRPGSGIAPPVDEVECNIYFDLTCDFGLGSNVPVLTIPGKDVLWFYLRRQGTIEYSSKERTLDFLRSQITFYRDFIMANQDPFEVSKGGKLVAQRIFLNPLRVAGDEISGTPTTTQSETGFTVDNITVNSVDIVNEDGITFPEGTVIQFDVEAPGSLGVDLEYDEVMLYFNFVTVAGLELRISHPLRVVDAVEVR